MIKTDVNMYNFLSSKTKRGLRDKIYKHQLKSGRLFDYKIIFDGEEWSAWYYGKVEIEINTQKAQNKSMTVSTEDLKDGNS